MTLPLTVLSVALTPPPLMVLLRLVKLLRSRVFVLCQTHETKERNSVIIIS